MRVVSLLPSATEIVCALGCRDMLVGRSHECDFPADLGQLPMVSRPSVPVSGTSRAIDLAIKDRVRKALSIYEVDADVLQQVRPDVIVTQTQCEVCAVTPADVERAICVLSDRAITVVAMEPNQLADIWTDIERVARALGADGDALCARLQASMSAVSDRCARLQQRPTVVAIEWIEPLMTAGNWMPELIELAGGKSLLAEAGKHSPWMTWDRVIEADPEVLLISPCGFTVERTLAEMSVLTAKQGWTTLSAVRHGRVFIADGNAYFHRPGPRVVDSVEILAEILHGVTRPAREQPSGFMRFDV